MGPPLFKLYCTVHYALELHSAHTLRSLLPGNWQREKALRVMSSLKARISDLINRWRRRRVEDPEYGGWHSDGRGTTPSPEPHPETDTETGTELAELSLDNDPRTPVGSPSEVVQSLINAAEACSSSSSIRARAASQSHEPKEDEGSGMEEPWEPRWYIYAKPDDWRKFRWSTVDPDEGPAVALSEVTRVKPISQRPAGSSSTAPPWPSMRSNNTEAEPSHGLARPFDWEPRPWTEEEAESKWSSPFLRARGNAKARRAKIQSVRGAQPTMTNPATTDSSWS